MQFKQFVRKHNFLLFLGIILLVAVAFVGYSFYIFNLEKYMDDQDTVVYMQSAFKPDSTASLRVLALNHKDMEGIEGARVRVVAADPRTKKERTLYEGVTGKAGTAEISFAIPEDMEGEYDYKILTESNVGRDVVTRSVKIQNEYKILLSTDKPLYQPAQTIHVRALAMQGIDSKPAAKANLSFEIEDPKGNKLYKETVQTTEYGVAGMDYVLGEEINTGLYTVRASIGKTSEEKKVTVTRYVLPKFRVEHKTEKTYYLPGDKLSASVNAAYFFGKPVAGSDVEIKIYTYEGDMQKIAEIRGTTDDAGNYAYEYALPEHFIGLPLEKGSSLLFFNVSVSDSAGHSETITSSVPVAKDAILIDIIPESGRLAKGLENILYVVTAYPDGNRAQADVMIGGTHVLTNAYGIGEYRITPETGFMSLDAAAKDKSGHTGSAEIEFPKELIKDPEGSDEYNYNYMLRREEYLDNSILLRVDKPIYVVGEQMKIDVFSTAKGAVYIDVIKDKQTVLTRSADLEAGHASVAVSLDASLAGSIEVHAYKILRSSDVVRDSKSVYVNHADDVSLRIATDKESYLPAQSAQISFYTKYNGAPVASALGINIVDESVYALAEKEAGFEKYYFELEKEYMSPSYEIHGITLPDVIEKEDMSYEQRNQVASVLMAQAPSRDRYDVKKSSREEKQDRIDSMKKDYVMLLGDIGLALAFLIPVVLCLMPAYSYRKNMRRFARRLFYSFLATVAMIALFAAGIFLLMAAGSLPYDIVSEVRNAVYLAEFAFFLLALAAVCAGFAYGLKKEHYRTFILSASAFPVASFCFLLSFAQVFSNAGYSYNLYWVTSFIPLLFLGAIGFSAVLSLGGFIYGLMHRKALALGMVLTVIYPIALIAGAGIKLASGGVSSQVVFYALGAITLLVPITYYIYSFELAEKKKRTILFTLPTSVLPSLMFAFLLLVVVWQLGVFNVGQGNMAPTSAVDREAMETSSAGSILPIGGLQQKSLSVDRLTDTQGEFAEAGDSDSAENVHVRQYFPETMYSRAQLLTDERGEAHINLTSPDSITSWRITALASTLGGRIGSGNGSILVYQDFFIDLDLPVSLTQNDEISLPVMVYNYMPEKQTITLSLKEDSWYELLDITPKQISLDMNQVGVVYYRIKAKDIGKHQLSVSARGKSMGDALIKEIEVLPDGKLVEASETKPLDRDVSTSAYLPDQAINGSEKIILRIFPGIFSQVVSGLDSMLRMPYGCFEQTSSVAYPNVLILDYMKSTNQLTPEIQFKAEGYISAGYQRLLTFEAEPGGFSIFGEKPAERIVSAYGLMVFSDMSKVYPIDKNVITRIQKWLLDQERGDHWEPDGHYGASYKARNSDLAATCYITWSLLETGVNKDNENIKKAVGYIEKNVRDENVNSYTLATCSIALAKAGREDTSILDRLSGKAVRENDTVCWEGDAGSDEHSYYYMANKQGDIETTALAALAYMESDYDVSDLNKALKYLAQSKDASGGWGSTQSTVLSMKALLYSVSRAGTDTDAKIWVYMNGVRADELSVDNGNKDVLQQIDLSRYAKKGDNRIELKYSGKGNIFYQAATKYYVPYEEDINEREKEIEIKVDYDKKELHTGDIIGVTAYTKYNGPGVANYVILDLGIPPGFDVYTEDLEGMVNKGIIEKYDITGRQVIVYVRNLDAKGIYVKYRIKARYSIRAKTPGSHVYDYYNPDISDQTEPIEINTLEGGNDSTDKGNIE